MKLLELHIKGFGKINNRKFTFSDGINVVYGTNEAGKSTLHTFIQSMFFGLTRARGVAAETDTYTRFRPWDANSEYGGYIRFEQHGITYRIERDFRQDPRSLVLIDENIGQALEPTPELMDEITCGLSETAYSNTISIGQLKSATDGGMVNELKSYISNMNTSGSLALNVTKATTFLNHQKSSFEQQMVPEAARTYTALLGDIRKIEKELSAPEYENQLSAYETMRMELKKQADAKQEEQEALIQKIASSKQILGSNQFHNEESIHTYENETKKIYADYVKNEKLRRGTSLIIGAVVCLLLAILSGFFFLFIAMRMDSVVLAACSAVLTLTFSIVGILLIFRRKERKRNFEYSQKLLQEIFSRHLGDPSISETAMEAFLTRMEEFVRLSETLVKSEASLLEQTTELTKLQEQQTNYDGLIVKQQQLQWELEKKLERLSNCKDRVEALKPVLAENDRLRDEISAIDLAIETMAELSASIRGSFGLYLNKTASNLINDITGGIYSSMRIDENLNIFMNTRTRLVPVEQVSSGTMDQIYLALRLAAARLIQYEDDQMPLIFDDSFVLYDDERLQTVLSWLAGSYHEQKIIFTCHRREEQIMSANQIKYHLIRM